jgi:hypothetical protein
MDPFVGKYFSVEYIRRHVLGQKDTEYKDIDKQIRKEIASGISVDPAETNAMDQMTAANTALAPEIQDQQAQDAAEREAISADAAAEREVDKAKKMPSPSTNNK